MKMTLPIQPVELPKDDEDKFVIILREIREGRETQDKRWEKIWEKANSRLENVEAKQKTQEREQALIKAKLGASEETTKSQVKGIPALKKKISDLEGLIREKQNAPTTVNMAQELKAAHNPCAQRLKDDRRWEEWERERRKCNITISGWDFENSYGKEDLELWLEEKLDITLHITKTWMIRDGKKMLGAECKNKEFKEEIESQKKKLTGSNFFINYDSTYKERRNKEVI